jgi:TPR repeat protein
MVDIAGIAITSIQIAVELGTQVVYALRNAKENPAAVKLLLIRYQQTGENLKAQTKYVTQASKTWLDAFESVHLYFTAAHAELRGAWKLLNGSRYKSLFYANPIAAKILRLSNGMDQLQLKLTNLDGFGHLKMAAMEQTQDMKLLLQAMGSLQTRVDAIHAVQRQIPKAVVASADDFEQVIRKAIQEAMQNGIVRKMEPEVPCGGFDGPDASIENIYLEEECTERLVESTEAAFEEISRHLLDGAVPSHSLDRSVGSILERLWRPWQLNLDEVRVSMNSAGDREIPEEIGRGSTGIVYKVKLRSRKESGAEATFVDAAAKVLDATVLTRSMKADFIREVALHSELDHPCIIQFMGAHWPQDDLGGPTAPVAQSSNVGQLTGAIVLTELMSGSVASLRKLGMLMTRGEVTRVLNDSAEGLQYLHEHHFVHMNLKPENVLVQLDEANRMHGCAKLSDFCVSRKKRYVTSSSLSVSAVALENTALYMAPELVRPETRAHSACDVWSFGVLMCQLLLPSETTRTVFELKGAKSKRDLFDGTLHLAVQRVAEHIEDDILRELAVSCLSNRADERPSIQDIRITLATCACGYDGVWAARARGRIPDSLFNIGVAHYYGYDTARDDHSAFVWLRIAAALGNTDAEHMLSLCFEDYSAAAVDRASVVSKLRKAIENADKRAYVLLGLSYATGTGVPHDMPTAVKFYEEGAEAGNSLARNYLGLCHYSGTVVTKDYAKAVMLFQLAASMGNRLALVGLGECHKNGFWLTKNVAKAIDLYNLASASGNAHAQRSLGDCFREGIGVEKNISTAVNFYIRAAEAGNATAQLRLGECYRSGTGVPEDMTMAFLLYQKSADAMNSFAQNRLGECYQFGFGVKKDLLRAVHLFHQAASVGNPGGCDNLADCYMNGVVVVQDLGEAIRLYTQASDAGSSWAQNSLGNCYRNGLGTSQDLRQAFAMYRKAAAAGNVSAKSNLGDCYRDGIGVTSNMMRAAELYDEAARLQSPQAQTSLGDCFRDGNGVKQDYGMAFLLYRKAANSGNSLAKNRAGVCYQFGIGVKKDPGKACQFFREAAEAGNADALDNLGDCFLKGIGAQRDERRAFTLYSQAANAGSMEALHSLGNCYRRGVGVAQDVASAAYFFSLAAERGHVMSQTLLGGMYLQGRMVTKNDEIGVGFYRAAAEAGDANAQNALGDCYMNGIGVARNPFRAAELYHRAAAAGNAKACSSLSSCYKHGVGVAPDPMKAASFLAASTQGRSRSSQYRPGEGSASEGSVLRSSI